MPLHGADTSVPSSVTTTRRADPQGPVCRHAVPDHRNSESSTAPEKREGKKDTRKILPQNDYYRKRNKHFQAQSFTKVRYFTSVYKKFSTQLFAVNQTQTYTEVTKHSLIGTHL